MLPIIAIAVGMVLVSIVAVAALYVARKSGGALPLLAVGVLAVVHLAGYGFLVGPVSTSGITCGSALSWFDSYDPSTDTYHYAVPEVKDATLRCDRATGTRSAVGIGLILVTSTVAVTNAYTRRTSKTPSQQQPV